MRRTERTREERESARESTQVDECSQSGDTSAQRTRDQEISFIPRQLSVCTLHNTATSGRTDAPTFPDQTRPGQGDGGGGQLDTAQKEKDTEMGMGMGKGKQSRRLQPKENPLPRSQQPPQPSCSLDMVGAQKTKRAPEIPEAGPE